MGGLLFHPPPSQNEVHPRKIKTVVLGSWIMVLGSWFLVLGSWFLVLGSWFLVLGFWILVLGSWFLVLGSWFLVLGSWFLDHGSWFLDGSFHLNDLRPICEFLIEILDLIFVMIKTRSGFKN